MAGALAGLRVLERSSGSAAAYAGRLFAACGADVTMVEPPGGTPLRREPPFVRNAPEASALFMYLAAGKSSTICDLTTTAGRARFEEMLATADVLFDDTPVGERAALGLDPKRVARDFPNLVFVSILPFGAFGPRADWRATELGSLHSGGEGYLMPNGLAIERHPDRPPVKIYGQFASFQGGTAGATVAMAALIARPQERGQFVDVSVQDSNVAESAIALQRWADGVLETRATRSFRYGGVLECLDGEVEVLTLEQSQWEALVKMSGESGWADSTDFDDPSERSRRGAEINRHLRAWAKRQPVDDVVRRGRELDVPIAAFASPREVLENLHAGARDFVPFRFSATPAAQTHA